MRIWQIDAIRGVAVILMVAFHFVFDLTFFFGVPVAGLEHGFWFYIGRLSAILFIGVSGVMSAVVARKYGGRAYRQVVPTGRQAGAGFFEKKITDSGSWKFELKMLKRAGRILAAAMLVSAVTYFFDKNFVVLFGILHFLAVSVLLAIFFVRLKEWNLLLAALILVGNLSLRGSIAGSFLLLPFGFPPAYFQSFDYYPLLPWFSVFLAGIGLGNFYLKKSGQAAGSSALRKSANLSRLSGPGDGKPVRGVLQFCGRHSLAIYLVHQPVLLGLLYFWSIYF